MKRDDLIFSLIGKEDLRQREGIDAALAKGPDSPFKGRPATIEGEKVNAMRAKGMTPTAIAKALGVARSSVYRYL